MRFKVTTTQYTHDDANLKRRTVTVDALGYNIVRGILVDEWGHGLGSSMTLPDEWDEHFHRLYLRTYEVLLTAGCDDAQARAMARERVEKTAQKMISTSTEGEQK